MAALTASIPDFNFFAAQGASLFGRVVGRFERSPNNAAGFPVRQTQKPTTSPDVSPTDIGSDSVPAIDSLNALINRPNLFDTSFADALNEALFLADQREIENPDHDCWSFARAFLRGIFCNPRFGKLELPLILPLDLGGLSAEWHNHGLNIEIRFRASQPVYLIIEDARAQIKEYRGRDPSLARAFQAIIALAHRSN